MRYEVKAILRADFMTLNAYVIERFKISNLFSLWEAEEITRKKIIKMEAEVYKV